jgi:glutamate formiminotransferase/formiminotetrahydrofolate cyclodeaminase
MASVGAALGSMVGLLSHGRRKFEDIEGVMREHIPPVYDAMQQLVPMIDADTQAFGDYMDALGMPKDTDDARVARHAAMQAGLQKAVEVPLRTMRIADQCWDPMIALAEHINIAMRSDLEVGARSLETGVWGCCRNVLINLHDIEDNAFCDRTRRDAEALAERAAVKAGEVLEILAGRSEG